MQYDVSSPEEYLEALDHDWRKDRLWRSEDSSSSTAPSLRRAFSTKCSAMAVEIGSLRPQCPKGIRQFVRGFNRQDRKCQRLAGVLQHREGMYSDQEVVDVRSTGLEEFIKKTIDLWRNGQDTSC